jgi:hypothetical protein
MIRKFLAAAALILAACSERQPEAEMPASGRQSATSATPIKAKPRLIEEKGDLLEFTYGWPAEADAIPTLKRRFEEDLATQRKQALASAREDFAVHGKNAHEGHSYRQVWETFGSNPLLLSLASEIGTFTGGVHGNATYTPLLWYRSADREIKVEELFGDSERAFNAMTAPYCAELGRQRAEKRVGLPQGALTPAEACKPLEEQAIVPVDADRNGKFERMRILIGPYGAGTYVEGTYEIDIPITPQIRGLLRPEYLSAF